MKEKQPCGCIHDGLRWLRLCPVHQVEVDTTHARWASDHQAETLASAVTAALYRDPVQP